MPSESEPIRVRCGNCGKVYALKPEDAGKHANCGCGEPLKVPALKKGDHSGSAGENDSNPSKSKMPLDPASNIGTGRVGNEPADANTSELDAKSGDDDVWDLELEPPIERQPNAPVVARPPEEGNVDSSDEQAACRERIPERPRSDNSSWGLKFLGVYGILIMVVSAGLALVASILTLFVVTRPQVTMEQSLVIFAMLAFHLLVMFVIYRLGRALLYCEHSAVDGLLVSYAFCCAMAYYIYARWRYEEDAALILAIAICIISVVCLPPIIVGYACRHDLRRTEDE